MSSFWSSQSILLCVFLRSVAGCVKAAVPHIKWEQGRAGTACCADMYTEFYFYFILFLFYFASSVLSCPGNFPLSQLFLQWENLTLLFFFLQPWISVLLYFKSIFLLVLPHSQVTFCCSSGLCNVIGVCHLLAYWDSPAYWDSWGRFPVQRI